MKFDYKFGLNWRVSLNRIKLNEHFTKIVKHSLEYLFHVEYQEIEILTLVNLALSFYLCFSLSCTLFPNKNNNFVKIQVNDWSSNNCQTLGDHTITSLFVPMPLHEQSNMSPNFDNEQLHIYNYDLQRSRNSRVFF